MDSAKSKHLFWCQRPTGHAQFYNILNEADKERKICRVSYWIQSQCSHNILSLYNTVLLNFGKRFLLLVMLNKVSIILFLKTNIWMYSSIIFLRICSDLNKLFSHCVCKPYSSSFRNANIKYKKWGEEVLPSVISCFGAVTLRRTLSSRNKRTAAVWATFGITSKHRNQKSVKPRFLSNVEAVHLHAADLLSYFKTVHISHLCMCVHFLKALLPQSAKAVTCSPYGRYNTTLSSRMNIAKGTQFSNCLLSLSAVSSTHLYFSSGAHFPYFQPRSEGRQSR